MKTKFYKKEEIILFSDEPVNSIGIILRGSVQIIKEDISGNINLITALHAGEIFGESLAFLKIRKSPVTIKSMEESEIMFLDVKKIVSNCPNSCSFHKTMIENLLFLMAQKNVLQNFKIEILSKKSIRQKLYIYLYDEYKKQGTDKFTISFSRLSLSEFLCVDRSALSKELSKMQNENLIVFNKNKFELLPAFFKN